MKTTFKHKPWPALAELDPGIEALEYNVVVLMPEIQEKTSSGIILADDTKDRESTGETVAMIASISPMAFSFAEWPRDRDGRLMYEDRIPREGDVVRIKKYAGTEWKGDDDRNYRIVNDKEILGRRPSAKAVKIPNGKAHTLAAHEAN